MSDPPAGKLTAEERDAIDAYLGRYAKILGIPSLLALAAALAYIVFAVPNRVAGTAIDLSEDRFEEGFSKLEDRMERTYVTQVESLCARVQSSLFDIMEKAAESSTQATGARDTMENVVAQIEPLRRRVEEARQEVNSLLESPEIHQIIPVLDAIEAHGEAATLAALARKNEQHLQRLDPSGEGSRLHVGDETQTLLDVSRTRGPGFVLAHESKPLRNTIPKRSGDTDEGQHYEIFTVTVTDVAPGQRLLINALLVLRSRYTETQTWMRLTRGDEILGTTTKSGRTNEGTHHITWVDEPGGGSHTYTILGSEREHATDVTVEGGFLQIVALN